MSLHKTLAGARGEASQESIAEKCGVRQVTISSWESGETRPRYNRLPIVAKGYGLPLGKLRALWAASFDRMAA